MSKIIGNYSGLSAEVTSTSTAIPELVQYYCTDWDFLLTRADANGMVVTTPGGKVSVFRPDKNSKSVLTVEYGVNMRSFDADLNSISQFAKAKATAWDFQQQKMITAEAANGVVGAGNLSSKKLSDVVGLSEFQLQTAATESSDELTDWAKAQIVKSEYAKI